MNFVNEYMLNVYAISTKDEININVNETNIKYELLFAPIDFIVVLDSLIDNSKKANAKNIYIEWVQKEEAVELHFFDDGKGISSEILHKIFDYRFTTTGGGGLGLYHVNNICEKNNIKIQVENQDKGVKFIFTFNKKR